MRQGLARKEEGGGEPVRPHAWSRPSTIAPCGKLGRTCQKSGTNFTDARMSVLLNPGRPV